MKVMRDNLGDATRPQQRSARRRAFFVLTAQAMTFRSAARRPGVRPRRRRPWRSTCAANVTHPTISPSPVVWPVSEGEPGTPRGPTSGPCRPRRSSSKENLCPRAPGPDRCFPERPVEGPSRLPRGRTRSSQRAPTDMRRSSPPASIAKYRPFLVLEINGKGPKEWPPPGLTTTRAPMSSRFPPDSFRRRRASPMSSTRSVGVTTLEVATYAER